MKKIKLSAFARLNNVTQRTVWNWIAKGKRFVLPHSRVMIHQVSSGMQGKAEDLEVEMEQTLRCKKELYDILSKNTGKPYERIEADCKKDFWLIGNEAVEYGLADVVLEKENA